MSPRCHVSVASRGERAQKRHTAPHATALATDSPCDDGEARPDYR